jgi:hypothetical protein
MVCRIPCVGRESLEENSICGAEVVFQQALKSLNEVEGKRFVIANVLESLKNGQSINMILPRYAGMGLVPQFPPPTLIDETNPFATTQALLERKSLWERVTTSVAQIAVNAVKTVPKLVEIKPHFGLVGPVPTRGFTLKGKVVSVYELFEALSTDREGSHRHCAGKSFASASRCGALPVLCIK